MNQVSKKARRVNRIWDGFALILFALLAAEARPEPPSYISFPSDVDWVRRDSDHFKVIFRRGEDRLAERTLLAAERAHALLTPIFPKGPDSTWIVVADFSDSLNGYALDLPWPHIAFFAAPPEASGQLENLDSWLDSVLLHEYVHILHIYPASGAWKLARHIFGSWVLPNGLLPSHLHEGIATFLETELTRGGRGRGSDFNMFRRVAVDEKVWGKSFFPLDLFDGSASRYPHGASPYFFGYTLYRELWDRQGARGIYQLTDNYSRNLPYLLDPSLEAAFGTDYDQLWRDIFRKTGEQTQAENAAIRRGPLSNLKYVTETHFTKWDPAFSPDGQRVAYRRGDPQEGVRLEILDLEKNRVADLFPLQPGPRDGLCWGKNGGKEYLLLLETVSANGYQVGQLFGYDLQAKKRFSVETESRGKNGGGHLHALGCSPDLSRLVVYRETAGQGTLEELHWEANQKEKTKPGRRWELPEGTWVASVARGEDTWFSLREGLRSGLYRWKNDSGPVKQIELRGHLFDLKAPGVAEPRMLMIGNLEGRQEGWAWDPATGKFTKVVGVLGGINGIENFRGRYLVSSYRQGGYDLAWASAISQPAPARTGAGANSAEASPASRASRAPAGTTISATREYSPWGTLTPTGWIPSLLVVPNGVQFGAAIPGFDLSQKHVYDAFAGYDTRGLPFADIDYTYRFGRAFSAAASAYFLPSYIISSREFLKRWGTTVGLGANLDLGLGRQDSSVGLSAIFKRLEPYKSVAANQSVGVGLDLSQSWNFRRKPLSISPLSGTKLSVSHQRYFKAVGSNDDYISTVLSGDQYLEMPVLEGHVWHLGAQAGLTSGTSLINNYFQGGGELIFSQGRGFFLNRGFYPGTFLGRKMFAFNLEYRFPIANVERGYWLYPTFLRRIHAALVADVTSEDISPTADSTTDFMKVFYTSVGAELKSDWLFSYYLPTAARVGAYHGFGPYGVPVYVTFAVEAAL